MLVSLKELLEDAEVGNYAVIAPDFPNLEVADALLSCAEQYNAPLALSFSPSLKPFIGLSDFSHFIRLVREMAVQANIPVALHLDHAHTIKEIDEAIQLGFTSVMIDASTEPWETNVELSKKVVEMAHPLGISVEAELGHVATSGRYLNDVSQHGWLTDPQEAAAFVQLTGIDALAVAIGTVHGLYAGEPNLEFDRLQAIRERVLIPLVLHGSSGTGKEKLHRCVDLGIRKINVYSDLIKTIVQSAQEVLAHPEDDPLNFMQEQRYAIYQVLGEYITVSGSAAKADNFRNSIKNRIRSLFLQGYTCAEAIYLAFAEREGFYSDYALQIQSLLGGGVCNQGGICGALFGGLAVIAARHSSILPTARLKRKEANFSGAKLIESFKARHSTVHCIDLTGTNFLDAEQVKQFVENKGVERTCLPVLMSVADSLLENLS
ncbi:ketose-bisphosphate aldolase [Bellilinea caldifistulae]|uniref:ketose-bisphosphate aldolase n=1 Tax=Bellilinea caldifistulae TaxID=360411 RepID=UPI0007832939|nr:ketose-bisphosphate aldolase [Bellilinea caldifistulae]GAP09669.1 ketose-bisphosphate aldolase [Bellilinea caldifistulae]